MKTGVDISVNGSYFIVNYGCMRISNLGEAMCKKGDVVEGQLLRIKISISASLPMVYAIGNPKTHLSLINDQKHIDLLNEAFSQSDELYKISVIDENDLDDLDDLDRLDKQDDSDRLDKRDDSDRLDKDDFDYLERLDKQDEQDEDRQNIHLNKLYKQNSQNMYLDTIYKKNRTTSVYK